MSNGTWTENLFTFDEALYAHSGRDLPIGSEKPSVGERQLPNRATYRSRVFTPEY
jgi:hypothetical protein